MMIIATLRHIIEITRGKTDPIAPVKMMVMVMAMAMMMVMVVVMVKVMVN